MFSNYSSLRTEYKHELLFKKKYSDEIKTSKILQNELKANEKFLKLVNTSKEQIDKNFHFDAIDYYQEVQSLPLFKLTYSMPKGGLLHHHFIVHGGPEYYSKIIIEEDLCCINIEEESLILLNENQTMPNNYTRVKDNSEVTVEHLQSVFHFNKVDKEKVNYWEIFSKKIFNMKNISLNSKYYKSYLLKTFNDCIDEGMLIYQGRHFFGTVNEYGKDSVIEAEKELEIILEALEEVRKREPLFQANFIFIGLRFWNLEKLSEELAKCLALKKIKKEYNELIIGFDLVGNEELADSKVFAELLYEFKQKAEKENCFPFNYYLHAGESLSHMNDNLIDSILLNTPRIGHCTNLKNQLYLIDEIKKRNICLECNPLSNQILNYIPDLRDHPAKKFLDAGLVVTLNSDDDGAFNTESMIVFDYFIAAFSMNFDLFDFKQIILNSINHSGIDCDKVQTVKEVFLNRWAKFIEEVNNTLE